jgi:Sensors of blue-light using FAD
MNLTRIVYYSERSATVPMDVRQMLATCHNNNARDGLTGYLFVNNHYYLQVLEGGRGAVSACYHRIAADPRHTNIVLISCLDVRERLFPAWSMGMHEGMNDQTKATFLRYFATEKVDPMSVNADSLLCVLRDLSSLR